jgi:hypothetical protein
MKKKSPKLDFLSKKQFARSVIILLMMLISFHGSQAKKTILADEPFNCNSGIAYQTINSTADGNASLYGFNIATGTKTLIATLPYILNGLIYNSVDDMLWASRSGTSDLIKIGSQGETSLFPIANMPTGFNVGAALPGGYMLLYNNNNPRYYVVDVNPSRATYLQLVDPTAGFALQTGPTYGTALSSPMLIADLAFVSSKQLCYGLTASGAIATLDPFTGNVVIGAEPALGLSGTDSYGAVFSDATGRLYAFQNSSGTFYKIDIQTNEATAISTGTPSGNNDGASCASAILVDLPFNCNDGIAYQTINSETENTSGLYGFEVASGVKTLLTTLPYRVNGLIYSSVDDMLWASRNGTNHVIRIDKEGGAVSYPIANLPNGFNVGAELPTGYMMLYNSGNTHYYVVDVNPSRATYLQLVDPTAGFALQTGPTYGIALSSPIPVADLAFVSSKQLCYGLTASGAIATLDPFTGTTTIEATPIAGVPPTGTFGAVFSDISGRLYAFHNSTGSFYIIHPSTNTGSFISTGEVSNNNDGASCANTSLVHLPFDCTDNITYQVAAPSGNANSSLYAFNVSTGVRTLIAPLPFSINGLMYNSLDNMLWGSFNTSIVRIDREGGTTLFPIANLPFANEGLQSHYNVGTELPGGYMLLYRFNSAAAQNYYYVVDLNPDRPTYLQLVDPTAGYALKTGPIYGTLINSTTPFDIADIAFVNNSQLCYTITSTGTLVSLDPFTGNVEFGETPVSGLPTGTYGAVVSDVTGRLYAFHNTTGAYYRINTTTNTSTFISTSTPSGNNDGASCANTILEHLPFTCDDGTTFQVAAETGEEFSSLYRFDVATGVRTLIAPMPYILNGLVYNSSDDMLWANINSSNRIVRIDHEGGIVEHTIANLPNGFNVGVELPNAYMMLTSNNNSHYYVIDINASRPTYLQLVDPTAGFVLKTGPDYGTPISLPINISDIAFISSEQLCYGVTTEGKLASLNPFTGMVEVKETAVNGLPTGGYGAIVTDASGLLYAFHNGTGAFYRINPTENSSEHIATFVSSFRNDGANCSSVTLCDLPYAPVVSQATVAPICPLNTVDLTTLVTSETPVGSTLAFYTSTTPSEESLVVNPTLATSGTYYAFYINTGCALSTEITVMGCSLPVTLVSFTLTKESSESGDISLLNWSTTAESNSESFQIERSFDGRSWNQIHTLSAQGESTDLINYAFIDAAPLNGKNYYRLKMIDIDGTYMYSRILVGEFSKAITPVYPNPASRNIFFTNYKEIQGVKIYNAIGREVLHVKNVSSEGLDVSRLSQGIYITVITLSDGSSLTQKVIITK